MASNTYNARRMKDLKFLRRLALLQAGVQGFLVIIFGLLGTLAAFSITWGGTALIAAGIVQLLIHREDQKLVIERLAARERQEDEDRRRQRVQRITKLLTGPEASKDIRYTALVQAGAIKESADNPSDMAYKTWLSPSNEEWAILDFFFKQTEPVALFMQETAHLDSKAKGEEFINQQAQTAFRKLNQLWAHQARTIDDIIWQASTAVDTQ